MAREREKYGLDPRIACVSPLWKHTSGSSVVTLKMRPPSSATPFTSLDTFMAAHSPRRFCQARQRYLLKPLGFDKRITAESGFEPVNKSEERPRSRNQSKVKGTLHLSNGNFTKRDNCSPNYSSQMISSSQDSNNEQEQIYNRILHLGKCKLSSEDDLIEVCNSQEKFKATTSFRPATKLPFAFSRSASISNATTDTTDLIAIGTISMTTQRQPPTRPQQQSRWKTKSTLNLKGSKYQDPMVGAPPSFHARMSEMAQLEIDTIKYEKGRKVKKKSPS